MLTYIKNVFLLLVFVLFFGTVATDLVYGESTTYISNTAYSSSHSGGMSASGSTGIDGSDGRNGADGADGISGADGLDGRSGSTMVSSSSSISEHVVSVYSAEDTEKLEVDIQQDKKEKIVVLQMLIQALQELLSLYVFQ